MEKYLLYGLVAAVCVGAVVLLKTPLRWGVKLLINTALGLLLLFVFNFFGSFVGVTLGLNLINGIVVGIFGPLGLVLLLLLRWLTVI